MGIEQAEHAERDDAADLDTIDGFLNRFAGTVSTEMRAIMRDELVKMLGAVEAHDDEPATMAG